MVGIRTKNDVTADVGLTALLVQIAQIVITLGLLNVIYKFYERNRIYRISFFLYL